MANRAGIRGGRPGRVAVVTAAGAMALVGVVTLAPASGAASAVARAELRDAAGNPVGDVRFTGGRGNEVTVRASVRLPVDSPEFHGFHIHANDVDPVTGARPGCVGSGGFVSVGGHWDVGGHTHGSHSGDLPSLARQGDGEAEMTFVIDKFTLSQVMGRALIVHAGADNFANIPRGTASKQYTDNGTAFSGIGGTAATGNAGARFACGVIEGTRKGR